jgi:hypothetical protein
VASQLASCVKEPENKFRVVISRLSESLVEIDDPVEQEKVGGDMPHRTSMGAYGLRANGRELSRVTAQYDVSDE